MDLIEEITPRQAQGGVDLIGLPSSMPDINHVVGGYRNDDLIVVGGATGSGKSSFCLTEAIHLARQSANVVYFSLEMSNKILALRTISAIVNIPAMKIEKGRLTDASFALVKEAAHDFMNLPLYFYDASVTTDQIKAMMTIQKNDHGLDVAIVDYLALCADRYGSSNYERVTHIADNLRMHAKDFDIPLIAASQLNRASLSSKPTLSSLKETGQIENNAGVVIFPYRDVVEEGVEQTDPDVEPATIIIAKNRHGPNNVEFEAEFMPKKMLWRQTMEPIVDPESAYKERRSIA